MTRIIRGTLTPGQQRIMRKYDTKILKTKTIMDCENVLRELVAEDLPSSIFREIYLSIENRGQRIKQNQQKILEEAAAAVATTEKMLASART